MRLDWAGWRNEPASRPAPCPSPHGRGNAAAIAVPGSSDLLQPHPPRITMSNEPPDSGLRHFSCFRVHKYVIMKVDGMPHPPSKGPRHVVGDGEGLQAWCP